MALKYRISAWSPGALLSNSQHPHDPPSPKEGGVNGRVLLVTGGLLTGKESSFLLAARKWWEQWRSADAAWLDFKVKLVMAEPLLAARLEALALPFRTMNPIPS